MEKKVLGVASMLASGAAGILVCLLLMGYGLAFSLKLMGWRAIMLLESEEEVCQPLIHRQFHHKNL